jgi:hypothetical protein
MTDMRFDRAPGDRPALAGTEGAVRRWDPHDWTGSCRGPHSDIVLGRQHVAALGARRAAGAGCPRDSPDGRASRVLPAHHDVAGQHEQFPGARARHSHRDSIWIMANLNENVILPPGLMNPHMQH